MVCLLHKPRNVWPMAITSWMRVRNAASCQNSSISLKIDDYHLLSPPPFCYYEVCIFDGCLHYFSRCCFECSLWCVSRRTSRAAVLALKNMSSPLARVRRDGNVVEIDLTRIGSWRYRLCLPVMLFQLICVCPRSCLT